jgi:hypothetical protein
MRYNPNGTVPLPPNSASIRCRVQGRVHFLNRGDMSGDSFLHRAHPAPTPIDATHQSFESRFVVAPFLSRRFFCNDRRTSPNAADIRTPGGRRGPP